MKSRILITGLTLSILGASSVMADLKCPAADEFLSTPDVRGHLIHGWKTIGNLSVWWFGVDHIDKMHRNLNIVSVTQDNLNCKLKIHPPEGEDYNVTVDLNQIKGLQPSSELLRPFVLKIIDAINNHETFPPITDDKGYTWRISGTPVPSWTKDIPVSIEYAGGGGYTRQTDDSGLIDEHYVFTNTANQQMSIKLQTLVFPNKLE